VLEVIGEFAVFYAIAVLSNRFLAADTWSLERGHLGYETAPPCQGPAFQSEDIPSGKPLPVQRLRYPIRRLDESPDLVI